MRTQITDSGVKLWLSANDTYNWATRPRDTWPCSKLAGNRLFAELTRAVWWSWPLTAGWAIVRPTN